MIVDIVIPKVSCIIGERLSKVIKKAGVHPINENIKYLKKSPNCFM